MLINQTMIYTEKHIAKKPKGLVIVTHGIALHSIYYRKLTELMNKGGYSVLLYDVRGHGKSQGIRGDIKDVKVFTNDLYQIVSEMKKENDLPIYLLGHSMGGVITNLYTTMYDNYDGSITLAAPSVPMSLGVLNVLPLRVLSKFRMKTNFKDERLSHFPPSDNVDPYALKNFTLRLGKIITRKAVIEINENIENIKKPILIVHGTEDKLVHVESARYLYNHIKSDKTLKLIESGYHNLNHDTVTEEVADEIIKWLDNLQTKTTT